MHPCKWHLPDLVPPAPFLQCEPHLAPGGSGVLADPAGIDEPGFPTLAALGKGRPALRNSGRKLRGGCLCCPTLLSRDCLARCLLMLFGVRVPLLVVLIVGGGGS